MAAAPAVVIILAGFFLPESPTSLIERDYLEEGRRVRPASGRPGAVPNPFLARWIPTQ